MKSLTVFVIYEGSGEWFDLSKKPIERASFTFGGAEEVQEGYFITDACPGCKLCYSKCPQKCIDISAKPAVIHQEIPADTDRQKVLLRLLMNVRHPGAISQRFLEVQDAYLQGELAAKHYCLMTLTDLYAILIIKS